MTLSRSRRLTLIAKMLGERRLSNQQELGEALARSGVRATQATLSRDLRSLGVVKHADGDESWYALPGHAAEALDRHRQVLDLKVFVNEVRVAQNLALVLTPPGHASAVGRAIDLEGFDGLVGSVAGDDTLLCVMRDTASAKRLKRDLDAISGRDARTGSAA